MRYVSTRGEAPPLGFLEATLAGLARDGGLYVPEAWPRLEPAAIAAFAGRPYAEVAVEVLRPFVGDSIAERQASTPTSRPTICTIRRAISSRTAATTGRSTV